MATIVFDCKDCKRKNELIFRLVKKVALARLSKDEGIINEAMKELYPPPTKAKKSSSPSSE